MTKKKDQQVEKKPEATEAASSKSKETEKSTRSSSSSSFLFYLSVIVVVIAFGVGRLSSHVELPLPDAIVSSLSGTEDSNNVHRELVDAPSTEESEDSGVLPDKYATDVVYVEPRAVASSDVCTDDQYTPAPLHDGKLVHVTEPMESETFMGNDRVFFMLNGANEGLYVSWNGQFECLARAAERAAQWLGADMDLMYNGVRLYSQLGEPVRTAQELAATRNMVHILLDFQIWVWPGIKKGYKYTLDNGVTLTTVGLSPKVYDVEHFFNAEEAQAIMDSGMPKLDRSKVDGSNSSSLVSASRTSHTAFLDDSAFTRDFRRRSARVARLPSPAFVERLQLVRYAAGEFYRQHLDTFHSKEFLPKNYGIYTMQHYEDWANWAAEQLEKMDESAIPEEFRKGSPLFPNAKDTKTFPNALMALFHAHMNASNLYVAFSDESWETWIQTNLDNKVDNLMPALLKEDAKPHYLPRIIKVWERAIGLPELRYTMPKFPVNGVSHYMAWIRWAKERISYLGDQVPVIARPTGELYPKYSVPYQDQLLKIVLEDYSDDFLARLTNVEWVEWMCNNVGKNNVLFQVVQTFPHFTEAVIKAWEARVLCPELRYKLPAYVKHFHPQRYVTLFLYLNDQAKIGGETVFPHSIDRFSDEKIERTGMDECSEGLAVPPRGLHASLFYVQTPEGDVDYMSRHGGCPPHEGIKWGSNSFMWNADADEGADLWTTK